jgi:hypothetical protein
VSFFVFSLVNNPYRCESLKTDTVNETPAIQQPSTASLYAHQNSWADHLPLLGGELTSLKTYKITVSLLPFQHKHNNLRIVCARTRMSE